MKNENMYGTSLIEKGKNRSQRKFEEKSKISQLSLIENVFLSSKD